MRWKNYLQNKYNSRRIKNKIKRMNARTTQQITQKKKNSKTTKISNYLQFKYLYQHN